MGPLPGDEPLRRRGAVARSSRDGRGRPGKANNTEQARIAKHSRRARLPRRLGRACRDPAPDAPAGRRGYPRPGPRGMLEASGDATRAPRDRRISMTAQPSDSGAAATKARTAEPLYGGSASRRVTVRDLAAAKARGEKWPMLTAYDALTARVFDDAGIPVLLVGDSAGMVVFGHDTTIPVTVDDLIPLTAAVVRGTRRAMVVADLPFGSYQASPQAALEAGTRFLKEAGAQAVKLEGGDRVLRQVEELVAAGIPVMGHLGLTPQSVNAFGGYRVQGRGEDGERLLHDAKALQSAGAFSVVLECVPAELAQRVTAGLDIPTIGIGAGPHCDAQVLVWQDMAGLRSGEHKAKFVKEFADLAGVLRSAAEAFGAEVRSAT